MYGRQVACGDAAGNIGYYNIANNWEGPFVSNISASRLLNEWVNKKSNAKCIQRKNTLKSKWFSVIERKRTKNKKK